VTVCIQTNLATTAIRAANDWWLLSGAFFPNVTVSIPGRPVIPATPRPPLRDGKTITRDGGGNPSRTAAILVPLFVIAFCFGGCWLIFEYAQLSKRRYNQQHQQQQQQQQQQQRARLPFMH
jgi:hypothetical protein